jgi:hypothetical protein
MYTYGPTTPADASPVQVTQSPVAGRWFGQVGGMPLSINHICIGGATAITFDKEVTIDKLGVPVTLYNYGTSVDIRLGIYEDDGTGKPGELLVDAGVLTISNTSGTGIKSVTLGTPVTLDPNTRYWLVSQANQNLALAGTSQAFICYILGNLAPYAEEGFATTSTSVYAGAIAYTNAVSAATALPSTFAFDTTNPVLAVTPRVLVSVSAVS